MFVAKRKASGAAPGFSPRRLVLASLIAAACVAPAWASLSQVWFGPIELPAAENPCMQNPNGPGCLGQWIGPYTLGATTPDCTGTEDDIGHAAVIPTGPDAGKVFVWTECDYVAGHTSWIWDAEAGTPAMASASFQGVHRGPFCSGHAWMVDGSGNARLLIVGGLDHGYSTGNPDDPCDDNTDPPFAVPDTSWFDPLAPGILPAPVDLATQARTWYPSTIICEDVALSGAFRCLPLTVGGSWVRGGCCITLSPNWYVLPAPYTAPTLINWTSFSAAQVWQEYPRVHYLSSNRVTTTGNDVVCDESSYFPGSSTLGGNPVRVIDLSTQTHAFGKDPNEASPVVPVGAMHMGNAVLMHTLKPTAAWPTFPLTSQFAADNYDLDRVITYGGAPYQGTPPTNITGLNITAELGASGANPASWTWKRKDDCPTGAVYGSLVVLPDGSLLRVGGQKDTIIPDPLHPTIDIIYRYTTERFFPKQPTETGVWKSVALRSTVSLIPRGYHSVAGLLKSGAVFLAGGRKDGDLPPGSETEDSAEVFKPPYFFQGTRPGLSANPTTIRYGEPFCVYTRDPLKITHASLIGVCSTTHHFDYGQRYVELLVTANLTGLGCGENQNLAILPPPKATMAPTNHYLLFLVDDKGRPSNGVFVQLSH